jgi:flagellar biosynthesis protein FlhF
MKIRTFAAANTPAAMAQIREAMGPAAVIISIDEAANGRGVIIRAAADEAAHTDPQAAPARSVEERLEALLAARLRPAAVLVSRAA